MGKLRARLTFANVISIISLLFALGLGGAWAATELSRNEVKSKHIGKGQIKKRDIAKNAVTSPKVVNGSLLGEDFAPGQLPAGTQGGQGPPGEPGEDATNLFAYISDPGPLPSGAEATVAYGRGATDVEDPAGDTGYNVTFNRSLVNCVVQAVAGRGNPASGGGESVPAIPHVSMPAPGEPAVTQVTLYTPSTPASAVDTSFLITAFC